MIIWKHRKGGTEDNYVGEAWLSASCGIPGFGHGLVADGSYIIDRVMGSFVIAYQPPDYLNDPTVTWITGGQQHETIQTLGWARVLAHEHHQIHALAREKKLRAQYEEAKARRPRPARDDDDDYVPG
jgi:hypothetical protein